MTQYDPVDPEESGDTLDEFEDLVDDQVNGDDPEEDTDSDNDDESD